MVLALALALAVLEVVEVVEVVEVAAAAIMLVCGPPFRVSVEWSSGYVGGRVVEWL